MNYSKLLAACKQSEASAKGAEVAVAAVHRTGIKYEDGLIVIRIGEWQKHNLTSVIGERKSSVELAPGNGRSHLVEIEVESDTPVDTFRNPAAA